MKKCRSFLWKTFVEECCECLVWKKIVAVCRHVAPKMPKKTWLTRGCHLQNTKKTSLLRQTDIIYQLHTYQNDVITTAQTTFQLLVKCTVARVSMT